VASRPRSGRRSGFWDVVHLDRAKELQEGRHSIYPLCVMLWHPDHPMHWLVCPTRHCQAGAHSGFIGWPLCRQNSPPFGAYFICYHQKLQHQHLSLPLGSCWDLSQVLSCRQLPKAHCGRDTTFPRTSCGCISKHSLYCTPPQTQPSAHTQQQLQLPLITSDMPAPKTACVTGATGYVASELIRQLLERGYAVKATVRCAVDAERLQVGCPPVPLLPAACHCRNAP
jgi:hypothetical protein